MRNSLVRKAGFCIFATCGALVLGSGCATQTSGIQGTAATVEAPVGTVQSSQYVIIDNSKLARGLQVVDLKSQFAGDLLKAQVSIVSKYSRTLEFQYKFLWFDAQGVEINPGSLPWTPLTLNGNESKTVQAVAPNPSAREFKINIRALK
jgi:uncharacterized protein YcfL